MGTHYSSSDADTIIKIGRKAVRRPNPVFLLRSPEEFSVTTNEGNTMNGKPGDYIGYDPVSGHVWPVAASYVERHYDFE